MAYPWIFIASRVPPILLRAQVARTLDPEEEGPRRRIEAVDFALEGFAVTGARLRGVAAAVREGRIGIKVDGTGPNFGASYTLGQNRRFTLAEYNFQPDDNWRAQMVHEAVHAAFDLANERPPIEIDEAAAYLAETAWFRAGGVGRTVTAPAASVPIHRAAVQAVAALELHAKPRQRLRRDQVQDLIAAINAHPSYSPSSGP